MKWQSAGLDAGYDPDRHGRLSTRPRCTRREHCAFTPAHPYAPDHRCMSFHAATAVLILLLCAPMAAAQTWPPRVQEIVDQLAAGVSHSAPDDERREVTRKIAEQVRFELGPNWGWKRADPGRPLSTDVFAMRSPFIGWDWSVPSGIAQFPEAIDLAGQVFVEVEPRNHLGMTPPDPGTPVADVARLEAKVDQLIIEVQRAQSILTDIDAKADQHAASEEAHWQAAKGKWERATKAFLKFGGKYLAPVIGGILAGVYGS